MQPEGGNTSGGQQPQSVIGGDENHQVKIEQQSTASPSTLETLQQEINQQELQVCNTARHLKVLDGCVIVEFRFVVACNYKAITSGIFWLNFSSHVSSYSMICKFLIGH